jgi:hypothetical protein
MAASGYTPIQLYYSTTATNVPTSGNLANGELGLNIADMKLYAKNSSGVVTLLASNSGAVATVSSVAVSGGTTGLTTSGGPITTTGTITFAGTLVAANGGTGFASYTVGDMLFASGSTAISKLSLGVTNYVLTAGASAPQYVAQSTLAVGTATNLAGGTAGSSPYQTGSGVTTFLSLGTSGYVLTAGASAPQYVAQNTLSVGTATNIAGGLANQIHYQSSAGVTAFAPAPSTAGYVLGWSGSAFLWVNAPAATSATNLTGGTTGDLPYQSGVGATSFLSDIAVGNALISGGVGVAPSYGKIGLTTHVSGTLPTANGGTNLTTFNSGGAMYASSASVLTTGTLPNTAGGTGQSSAFTQYGVTYASTTGVLATTAAGLTGQILTATTSGAPTWAANTAVSTGKSIAMAMIFGF